MDLSTQHATCTSWLGVRLAFVCLGRNKLSGSQFIGTGEWPFLRLLSVYDNSELAWDISVLDNLTTVQWALMNVTDIGSSEYPSL